jgi:hypothetical protein
MVEAVRVGLSLEMTTSTTMNRSVLSVAGEAGICQKVIPVDLEKAVKAVGSVIAGGHLGFYHCLRQAGLVGRAEAAPDSEGYKRHLQSPRFRMYQLRPNLIPLE